MKVHITVKHGLNKLAVVHGVIEVDPKASELGEKIIETEQFLERLTGLRFHIETSQH